MIIIIIIQHLQTNPKQMKDTKRYELIPNQS